MRKTESTEIFMAPEEAKTIRARLGWSLEKTAGELGVKGGRTNYWQFENGMRRFTFAQAELLRAYASGHERKETT